MPRTTFIGDGKRPMIAQAAYRMTSLQPNRRSRQRLLESALSNLT